MIAYTKKEIKKFMDGLDSGSEYMKQMASNFRYFSYRKSVDYSKLIDKELNDTTLKRAFRNQINPSHMIPKLYIFYFEILYYIPLKKLPLYINPIPKDIPELGSGDFFPTHKEFIKYIVRFRLSIGK